MNFCQYLIWESIFKPICKEALWLYLRQIIEKLASKLGYCLLKVLQRIVCVYRLSEQIVKRQKAALLFALP